MRGSWAGRKLKAGLVCTGIFCSLAVAPSASAQVSFEAKENLPDAGIAADTGDVNNDGFRDVVALQGGPDHAVVLFLQEPGDTFERVELPFAVEDPRYGRFGGLDIGDLDGDGGEDDIAVGVMGGVQAFVGESGVFEEPRYIPTPVTTPRAVVIADVFRDGDPDIVIGSNDLGTTLMRTDGDNYVPVYLKQRWTGDVSVGYLDGDGRPDVLSSGGGYATISHQLSNGGFENETLDLPVPEGLPFVAPAGVEAADVTGDGRADAIVAAPANTPWGSLYVVPQRSDGQLGPAVRYPAHDLGNSVEVADMNRDGRNDVVLGHGGSDRFGVYLQQAGGSLGAEALTTVFNLGFDDSAIAVGDVSCDERPDVLIPTGYGNVGLIRQTSPPPQVSDCNLEPAGIPPAAPQPQYDPGSPVPPGSPLLSPGAKPASGEAFLLQPRSVLAVDPNTGDQRLVTNSAISENAGGGQYLESPGDIEVGSDGTIYVGEAEGLTVDGAPAVIGIDPTTGRQRIVSSGGELSGAAIAVRSSGHLLTQRQGGGILDIDPVTGAQTVVTGAGPGDPLVPGGLEEGPGGVILATDSRAFSESSESVARVVAIDPASGAQQTISEGGELELPGLTALSPEGRLLTTDPYDGSDDTASIVSIGLFSGSQRIEVTDEPGLAAVDVAVEPGGNSYLIPSAEAFDPSLVRFNRGTGTLETVAEEGLFWDPRAIAVVGAPRPSSPSDLGGTAQPPAADEFPPLFNHPPGRTSKPKCMKRRAKGQGKKRCKGKKGKNGK